MGEKDRRKGRKGLPFSKYDWISIKKNSFLGILLGCLVQ